MTLFPGDVVERPGPWPTQHRGIFAGLNHAGQPCIIHNPKGGCVRYDTLDVFAAGQQVRFLKRVARNATEQRMILVRADSLLGRKYDLINFNCDHLVTYALAGVPTSPQLQALTGLAALCAIVAAFA